MKVRPARLFIGHSSINRMQRRVWVWPFLSHVDSSACPWSTVEQVGMSLTDTSRSRLTY